MSLRTALRLSHSSSHAALRVPAALALLLQAPLHVAAQTAPASEASDYVVTAARSQVVTRDSVRPVTVITAEDIRQAGAGSLTDLLRTMGGVEITHNGGLGQTSSIFMRGASSDHTVLIVDGVRLGSATLGTASFESIPLALIERVEVLPGPSSSLYGADAIGGVIQVFTKSALRSPGATVSLTGGSHNLQQAVAGYAGRIGEQTELSAGIDFLRTDGINATNADNTYGYNPDKDGYLNRGGHVGITQHFGPDQQVALKLLRSVSKVHYDDGPDPDADTRQDSYSTTVTQTMALQWSGKLSERWQSSVVVGRSVDLSNDYSTFPGTFKTTQQQFGWLNHVALAGGTATAGVEFLKQEVDSDTPYNVTERTIRSGMLGWRGSFGAHSVQIDLRQDRNSQFGNHGTGQLGWAYALDGASRVRASYGTAFHAPTFNELYYPGFGTPDLKPEHSKSFEFGADTRLGGADLTATLFDNRITDLIEYAPPDYLPHNVAKARIKGLVLTAGGQITRDLRAKLNFTWQDPLNEETDDQLRRRARVFGGLHLVQQLGTAQVGSDLTWVGKRYDADVESADARMGAYGLVDLFAGWAITPQWRVEGRVNNLADKRYTTAQGYNSPGREAQLTLRWTPPL
ncbi:TonB-dependent receptor [Ideonella azotifigens]|uniref:TonB-dependent vitamin B12 receptor n=1 Tax=Ideonella azotifigens TaxID=513160 RepID=A0ABN1KE86_9BURK|nr:TonB-dependent receptor [Ideonella azotifigens]MCD2340765.1 TonB-dependent receptor [Ideonella azotifigens]